MPGVIELHSVGEVFASGALVEEAPDELLRIVLISERGGRLYESVRCVITIGAALQILSSLDVALTTRPAGSESLRQRLRRH